MKTTLFFILLALSSLAASPTQFVYLKIEVVVAKEQTFNRYKIGTACEVIKKENNRYLVSVNDVTFWIEKRDVTK